jgi:hypothetical protein
MMPNASNLSYCFVYLTTLGAHHLAEQAEGWRAGLSELREEVHIVVYGACCQGVDAAKRESKHRLGLAVALEPTSTSLSLSLSLSTRPLSLTTSAC